MKRFLLSIAAVAALSGNSLFAQTLAGTWQGTLQSPQARGGQFRVVFKISTTPSDSFTAVMYNIDQGGRSVTANTVSLQGSTVRISLIPIGVTYEAMLSADGNSITGTWNGNPSQSLTLARATPETAWTIPEPPPPAKPMAPDADPTFEVATVKPSPLDARGTSLSIDPGGRMTIRNKSLANLITFAWNIHSRQLKGLPEGLGSERFDIEAKTDTPGEPNDRQVRLMLRKLITGRFMLISHQEKKEMSAYAISVAKSGLKLTKTQFTGSLPSERGMNKTAFSNTRIADLADFLQGFVLDRPVVDQSGIEGRYDFTLNWTPDETQFGDYRGVLVVSSNDPNAEAFPDLFTAMQQQLGLKLELTKALVDMLVIDHIEKPSAN